jgi:hypothetical protein
MLERWNNLQRHDICQRFMKTGSMALNIHGNPEEQLNIK